MNIRAATKISEDWMRRCATVVESDLRWKQEQMREDPFMFFRGTVGRRQNHYQQAIIVGAFPRPLSKPVGIWLIRRLFPDSNPIEIRQALNGMRTSS
jgi:hypothetical protein